MSVLAVIMIYAGAVEGFSDPQNDIGHWRVPRCVRVVPTPPITIAEGCLNDDVASFVFFPSVYCCWCLPACLHIVQRQ